MTRPSARQPPEPNIEPWSLRPLATAASGVMTAFFVVGAGAMLYMVPRLKVGLAGKVLIVIVALSAAGGAVASHMAMRYSFDQWLDRSFMTSTWRMKAPVDLSPEEAQLWWWCHAFNLCCLVGLLAMLGVAMIIARS
jgi:hypothetical protein